MRFARLILAVFCLSSISFTLAHAGSETVPMPAERQAELKSQLQAPTEMAEKYWAQAQNLRYAPVEKGQKISADECRAEAAKLNKNLADFWFTKRSGQDYTGTKVQGIDFCGEDELNVARHIFGVSFYWSEGDYVSATGLPARRALTLQYFGATEQFLIDANDHVIQYLNAKMEIGTTGRATIALTPDHHVISKLEHLYNGEVEGTELNFCSSDGSLDASRNIWVLGKTPITSSEVRLVEVGTAKPLVSVLTTLYIMGLVQGVRMDGALDITNRTFTQDGHTGRFWSRDIAKAPTKTCEQGLYSEKENEYFAYGDNDKCLDEFAPPRRPISPNE